MIKTEKIWTGNFENAKEPIQKYDENGELL